MFLFLFLFFCGTLARENFQVTPINEATLNQAFSTCIAQGKCSTTLGCCSGQGSCRANTTHAECVCNTCPGGAYYYTTASNCAQLANQAAFDACCGNATSFTDFYKQFHIDGLCNQRDSGVYSPEIGAKGNLLRRLGSANYGDGLSSNQSSFANIQTWIADLTSSSHNVTLTKFTMFAVAALQFTIKDSVDFALDLTRPFVVGGKTYYHFKVQENTGIDLGGGVKVPAAFENVATTGIDAGPLYDHTSRVVRSGVTLAYIDEDAAGTWWSTYHHVTQEFLVFIKLLAKFHNQNVHNIEDAFCAANSVSSNINYNNCVFFTETGSVTNADFINWMYETARRSTGRMVQTIVEQATLQILLENPTDAINGLYELYFDLWLNRDQSRWGLGGYTKIRTHQEFSSALTKTSYVHYALTGLDHFLSLRNPDLNLTKPTKLGDGSSCGVTVDDFDVAVLNLFHTPARRFGGRIDPSYTYELEVIFHRVNELGLSDYLTAVNALTDSPSTTGLSSGTNVYYGIQKETNAARTYLGTTPSVLFAIGASINDAILKDPTNFYGRHASGDWTGRNYHPKLGITWNIWDFNIDYCKSPCDLDDISFNGYNQLIEQGLYQVTTGFMNFRVRGSLFSAPADEWSWFSPRTGDDDTTRYKVHRIYAIGNPWGAIVNTLFYNYDGIETTAGVHLDLDFAMLVAPVADSVPYNLGWKDAYFDGSCYDQTIIDNYCNRPQTMTPWGECSWQWDA